MGPKGPKRFVSFSTPYNIECNFAGQKVSYQNATCAVGRDGLVACLNTSLGQHWFVLKPSGNETF